MAKRGVALCMIVRNEENTLERCLSSVASEVAEMIVVDTGSTDRTREKALACGAVVVSMPWPGSFAAARNVSLTMATQPWIFVMDADEEWAGGGTAATLSDLAEAAERRGALGCNIRLFSYIGAGEDYVSDAVCRLFRNDARIRFRGAVHEEAATSILRIAPGGIAEAEPQPYIRHYGYLDEAIAGKNKFARNCGILNAALQHQPDRPELLYALGTELFAAARYAEALAAFERIPEGQHGDDGYLSDLLFKTAYAYRETGQMKTATETADKALRLFPDFPDLLELRALLAMDEAQYDQALALLDRARQTEGRAAVYSSVSGAGTYRTLYLLGLAHERRGNAGEACRAYRQALLAHPGYAPAQRRLQALDAGVDRP